MMYGHGIKGLGFFHIEVPDIPPPSPSLQAIVTVLGDGVASPKMIEAELNHLYRCNWDWQATLLSGNAFSVVFPDAVSHGYGTRSSDITIDLNKLVVEISESVHGPKAVATARHGSSLVASLTSLARSGSFGTCPESSAR